MFSLFFYLIREKTTRIVHIYLHFFTSFINGAKKVSKILTSSTLKACLAYLHVTNCSTNYAIPDFFFFFFPHLRLYQIITPVTGRLAPIMQAMKARILVGNPRI